MYIILKKEEFLYNVKKVKNTVNISQTAGEIYKHYKNIWKGIHIPLFPIDFNFIIILFFLTVSMFLGEVIYHLSFLIWNPYFSILLTICTVDFMGRLTGQVIQIPELTPGAHMREL